MGEASNLKVTAFDAPGAQEFYQTLLDGLKKDDRSSYERLISEASTRSPAIDTNFRLYGDPVSTVGTPIGETITLQNPSLNPDYSQIIGGQSFRCSDLFFRLR